MPQSTTARAPLAGFGALELTPHHSRRVIVAADGGHLTSEAGNLAAREADLRIGATERLARCFIDHRRPSHVEHGVPELLRQKIFGLVAGYEDLNDHDRLRLDPLLALIAGKRDLTGQRPRRRDRGRPLASASTLNRLELSRPGQATADRYRRIEADTDAIDSLLIDLCLEAHPEPPGQAVLDIDVTDFELHGGQEAKFFHGYYRHYCHLAQYVFLGDHLLGARLRPSSRSPASGALDDLEPIVAALRRAWPSTRIILRGDADYSREEIMSWCEDNGVFYVLGQARNNRLEKMLARQLRACRRRYRRGVRNSRRYRGFAYRTLKSWSKRRRVVGKAEWIGKPNPRFVVTNLPPGQPGWRELYERVYCRRGDAENRICEQIELGADRASCHAMTGNQLRLYFAGFAYVILAALRRLALSGPEPAAGDAPPATPDPGAAAGPTGAIGPRARCRTIQQRLIRVAGRVSVSRRRVKVSLPTAYPFQDELAAVLGRLAQIPLYRAPPA